MSVVKDAMLDASTHAVGFAHGGADDIVFTIQLEFPKRLDRSWIHILRIDFTLHYIR
jgi:hypothetical protein